MEFAAIAIHRIRTLLGRVLPASWLRPPLVHSEGIHPRRGSSAEIEIEPGAPASSWVVWEVSPRRRRVGGAQGTGGAAPGGGGSEQREG